MGILEKLWEELGLARTPIEIQTNVYNDMSGNVNEILKHLKQEGWELNNLAYQLHKIGGLV